jgi:hypothetical protein
LEHLPEEMQGAIILGLGKGLSGSSTLEQAEDMLNMSFGEFLRKSGLTKDEYAVRMTGEANREVY